MHCPQCFSESPNTSSHCIQCGSEFFPEKKVQPSSDAAAPDMTTRVLATAAFVAVGWYTGVYFFILLLPTFAVFWLAKKLCPAQGDIFLAAISLQIAQVLVLTFVSGFSIAKGLMIFTALGFFIDLVIPVVGFVWLCFKPRFWAFIYLSLYQVGMLGFNCFVMYQLPVGDLQHKAIAAHMVWRAASLFYMWSIFFGRGAKNESAGS